MSKKKIFITVQQPQAPEKPLDNKQFNLDLVSLIVNVILAGVAIYVLFLTRKQTQSSIKSVEIAKQVFEDTKRYNEQTRRYNEDMFNFQKAASDSSALDSKKQFELQTQVINTQLKSLADAERRFILENEPYLQIAKLLVNSGSFGNYNYRSIEVDLTNLGKQPVQITKQRYFFKFLRIDGYLKPSDYDFILQDLNKKKFSRYPLMVSSSNISSYTDIQSKNKEPQIPTGLMFVDVFPYYAGEIHYYNVISQKKKVYKFLAEIKAIDKVGYNLIYSMNENE
ncbi:hypothetical protein ABIB40_000614 [Pedobacter sp. UYP30]|uniref:hypothetical protein n=1 Tax=Pedobacter sp. UYP30 TaxID=1756400 RepID=UPI003399A66A